MPEIDSEVLTDSQMRRAEALAIARSLYPHITPDTGMAIAVWIVTGRYKD